MERKDKDSVDTIRLRSGQALSVIRGGIGPADGGATRIRGDATVRYIIEAMGSTFTARAFVTGLFASFGHSPTIAIPDFEGEAVLNPDVIETSSLRIVIHAASLNATNDIPGKDREEVNRRMHEEVLESDYFSQIVYECSGVSASKIGDGQYWMVLGGKLTLHGVTRALPVSARVAVNGDVLRATGDLSIRQSDFQLRPVSAGAGTIRLKDEIRLSFDISARKQD
jgi:polyisoprenoid-binding protein YceI